MDRKQAVSAGMYSYRQIYVICVVQEKNCQNINPNKPGTAIKTRDLRFFNAFCGLEKFFRLQTCFTDISI